METHVAFELILGFLLAAELLLVLCRLRASDQHAKERAAATQKSLDTLLDALGAMRGELAVAAALQAQPPPLAGSRGLAVKAGTEIVELDEATVARIEALSEDLHLGRLDRSVLKRALDAGLEAAADDAPDSGTRRDPRKD